MPRRSDAAGAAPAPVGAQPAAVAPHQAAAAGAAPPPQALPSPPGLTYDTVVVQPEGTDGITLPKFLLPDGRSPRHPLVTYVHRDLSTKNISLSAPGCDGDVRAAKPHSGAPLPPAAQRSPLP